MRELQVRGESAGCVVRDPSRVNFEQVTVHRADMLDPSSLGAIGDGYTTAYYLVHSMGRGGDGDYEKRDVEAAVNFARFALDAGIEQVIYLGGLGDRPASQHLRSRLRVGEILSDAGPPLTWFRAGMVVGAGSESYRTLRSLVERLPVMLAPDRVSGDTHIRADARRDGRLAWTAPSPTDPGTTADAVALLALDRTHHTC